MVKTTSSLKADLDNWLKDFCRVSAPIKEPVTVEQDEGGVYIFKDAGGKIVCLAGQQFVDALQKMKL